MYKSMGVVCVLVFLVSCGDTNSLEIKNTGAVEPVSEKVFPQTIPETDSREKLLNQNKKAPGFIGLTNWINGKEVESLDELKGKVVFIDFWTYTCINCIRTLEHMQGLHEKYEQEGLVIIGIHAPEFSYERKIENVKNAVKQYGLTYRVVQDNDFKTWKNYQNIYWPAQYIIDKQGNIRYTHFGEGEYGTMDEVVAFLVQEDI